ncbi:GlsB/YeaQ/YmgE family stress response membrane protein [Sphingomonas sp. MMS12-HWE2-04]|uniref:GlsB/YeaQ/YmgE family stress response membrane protein n=1 Tax=Sphingomonas sp. MMS12-HWE2-04 TaxID=3234199 RepID=UPI00384D9ACB
MVTGPIGWLLIGLVAGGLGKLLMPGRDPGGIIVTILLGIAGALLARYLTPLLGVQVRDGSWQAYAAATAGAVVLLALYRMMIVRRI